MIENLDELTQMKCEKITYGAAVVSEEECNHLIRAVPLWHQEFHEGVEKLWREFHFVEFKDAFSFTYKLANMAEREDHHPSIMTEWGKVTVYWWTHKVSGLHLNDFIMAAKTDLIAKLSAKT